MSQASLFSALSASANLKANLGLNIKAPVLANLNLKGQANAQTSSKVDVKAPIKVEVKAPVQEKTHVPAQDKTYTPVLKETVKAILNVKAQAEVKLKEIITTPIKAEVKAEVKAQVEEKVLTPIKETLKVIAGASLDVFKDIKVGAHAIKPQPWEADKGQYQGRELQDNAYHGKEHKGFDKADKDEAADWKEGAYHKGGDTLDLGQLKHKFEGHGHNQDQYQGDSQAAYHHNTWQEPASYQPAHNTAWQAHGEATIELTGQVQHHDTAWHA